ncbi:discoidin domain-containing protein [Pseudodesulfovibrio sp.]|uniref:discoidin domain-containing protein n=1 Tax=unclassified Pseudodesulfovibrio TaxID=2661612 RepID=UPI003AFFAE22
MLQRIFPIPILLACLFGCLTASPAIAMDVTVSVSSVKVDFGLPGAPENLLDGDPESAWIGGGIGSGKGQWIDLDFGMPVRVVKLGIFNGNQAKGEFENYRRIRSGRIIYPDGVETQFWLRDESGEQLVECRNRPFKKLRIQVDQVFPKGDFTSKMKLAVSEIKLYLSLTAPPGGDKAEVLPESGFIPAPPPPDPERAVPPEIISLLREFYVRQTAMSDDYAELFAADVRDRNDFRMEVFKEMQRQRGTLNLLREAQVDTSNLGFEMVEREGGWAKVRVFGVYRVQIPKGDKIILDKNLEDDSTFVLSKEADGWRIVELEGEESLF